VVSTCLGVLDDPGAFVEYVIDDVRPSVPCVSVRRSLAGAIGDFDAITITPDRHGPFRHKFKVSRLGGFGVDVRLRKLLRSEFIAGRQYK